MRRETHPQDTRDRLLEAAIILFSQNGYHATSVRMIVGRARTNVAAVNYHFGGKEALYRAAILHEARTFHDEIGRPESPANAEQARTLIEGMAGANMRRLARGEGSTTPQTLLAWEMLNPTGALDYVIREEVMTFLDGYVAAVRILLGNKADEQAIRTIAFSLIGMLIPLPPAAMVNAQAAESGMGDTRERPELAQGAADAVLAAIGAFSEALSRSD